MAGSIRRARSRVIQGGGAPTLQRQDVRGRYGGLQARSPSNGCGRVYAFEGRIAPPSTPYERNKPRVGRPRSPADIVSCRGDRRHSASLPAIGPDGTIQARRSLQFSDAGAAIRIRRAHCADLRLHGLSRSCERNKPRVFGRDRSAGDPAVDPPTAGRHHGRPRSVVSCRGDRRHSASGKNGNSCRSDLTGRMHAGSEGTRPVPAIPA